MTKGVERNRLVEITQDHIFVVALDSVTEMMRWDFIVYKPSAVQGGFRSLLYFACMHKIFWPGVTVTMMYLFLTRSRCYVLMKIIIIKYLGRLYLKICALIVQTCRPTRQVFGKFDVSLFLSAAMFVNTQDLHELVS
jgi:hypothetical protein